MSDPFKIQKLIQAKIEHEFKHGYLVDKVDEWTESIPYMDYDGKKLVKSEYISARFGDIHRELTEQWATNESDIGLQEYIIENVHNL